MIVIHIIETMLTLDRNYFNKFVSIWSLNENVMFFMISFSMFYTDIKTSILLYNDT